MLAAFSGVIAAAGIMGWMNDIDRRANNRPVANKPSIDLATVVVAKAHLEFGATITDNMLSEIEWPKTSIPAGSYQSLKQLFEEDRNRTALISMQSGEPILKHKITGPGRRATLAAMLTDGMKAVSIRVNDVIGVGGFVLPGDRVDLLLTRSIKEDVEKKIEQQTFTDILLQNVRILAADQSADPKEGTPKIVRTITVEVSLIDAQKIALGSTVGEISLVLRENGTPDPVVAARRVSVADLAGDSGDKTLQSVFVPTNDIAVPVEPVADAEGATVKVNVIRSIVPTEYSVMRRPPEQ